MDNIFGGSKGRSFLSVSASPSLNRLYKVSPVTFPKIVCFLSSQSQRSRVMKN
uniref:Uncharacterized protein n=1 Tax=Lotus japonicus TaxID=34305 RepID=I3S1T9_LOTJA|nr:unknown [Lotus japonicus]